MTLRTTFSNVTSNTVAELQALHSEGEPGWKGLWTGLGCGVGGVGTDSPALSPMSSRWQFARNHNISENRGGKP